MGGNGAHGNFGVRMIELNGHCNSGKITDLAVCFLSSLFKRTAGGLGAVIGGLFWYTTLQLLWVYSPDLLFRMKFCRQALGRNSHCDTSSSRQVLSLTIRARPIGIISTNEFSKLIFVTFVVAAGVASCGWFRQVEGVAMLSRVLLVLLIGTLSVLCSAKTLPADEWGNLKGRIVLTGELPVAKEIEVTRDEEVCGRVGLLDESLLVNKDNRGVQNVIIWLSSKTPVPVHSSMQDVPEPAKLDNRNCMFVPRVVRLRTNQILQSSNSDSVAHNVAVYARRNQPFSIVIPEDKPLESKFAREELVPIRVDCSIHSWMRGYLIISEHPYSAVTDKDGKFEIKNLPVGEWEFRFWHERPGYLTKLTGAQQVELLRGAFKLKVEPSGIDLGDLQIDVSELAESD